MILNNGSWVVPQSAGLCGYDDGAGDSASLVPTGDSSAVPTFSPSDGTDVLCEDSMESFSNWLWFGPDRDCDWVEDGAFLRCFFYAEYCPDSCGRLQFWEKMNHTYVKFQKIHHATYSCEKAEMHYWRRRIPVSPKDYDSTLREWDFSPAAVVSDNSVSSKFEANHQSSIFHKK
eukprot:scaffold2581_cov280-Chaetoceros_neogracile.AAC.1